MVMNLGFAWGEVIVVFQPAWAENANQVIDD